MTSKTCRTCGDTKSLDAFHRMSKSPDGRQGRCRACASIYGRRRHRENPRRALEGSRRFRSRRPHHARARQFNLTEDQVALLTARPCEGCGAPAGSGESAHHIDHDHATGEVRGVLCHKCNRGIGYLRDSPELLRKLAWYLENHDLFPPTTGS